jgi:curved DNA-binding protein
LQNYYQILGLRNFASLAEIKNQFRKLAKLYHPDINPGSAEHFKVLLKAYEVLSDPYKRSQFDYKLKFQLNQQQQKASAPKQPHVRSKDVTEQELKRRQYYQEHFKKHYEQSQASNFEQATDKRTYNEFRNILVAAPVAVLLIMLLLNIWSDKPQIKVVSYKEEAVMKPLKEEAFKKKAVTGDTPYMEYFGGAKIDTLAKRSLKIKNLCGSDFIVFIFSNKKFYRSCYIEDNYEVDIGMLPKELSVVRIMKGSDFQYTKELPKSGVFGAFVKDCMFMQSNQKMVLNGTNSVTFSDLLNQGFSEVDEEGFFKTGSEL